MHLRLKKDVLMDILPRGFNVKITEDQRKITEQLKIKKEQ